MTVSGQFSCPPAGSFVAVSGQFLVAADKEARWFARDHAIALLRLLPYRPLAEPAVATLASAATSTTHWTFASPEADPHVSLSDTNELCP